MLRGTPHPPQTNTQHIFLGSAVLATPYLQSGCKQGPHLGDSVKWIIHTDYTISLIHNNITITKRNKIFKTLRNAKKSARSRALKNLPNQGKAAHLFSRAKVSSHYNRTGDFLRFTDWRFVHPARLNLLKLNGTPYRNQAATDNPNTLRCKKCSYELETLSHVLNHCSPNFQKITRRHNKIVDRIKRATGNLWTVYKENQPIGREGLKPDLILTKRRTAIIVDVTCPYEGTNDSLATARSRKLEHYDNLAS